MAHSKIVGEKTRGNETKRKTKIEMAADQTRLDFRKVRTSQHRGRVLLGTSQHRSGGVLMARPKLTGVGVGTEVMKVAKSNGSVEVSEFRNSSATACA
ncbi:hypothetical protein J6590_061299 [Homalodisca vitripennis]|nr:hypothetical protein J6590_061299 [Homalodisca vitripennis]